MAISILPGCSSGDRPVDNNSKIRDGSKVSEGPVKLTAQLGGSHYCDTTQYLFVKATLINNTSDTFVYVCMDCSWPDSYTTDSKDFEIEKTYCFKNGPVTIKIPPHGDVNYYLSLKSKKPLNELMESEFKIGFNLIKEGASQDVVSIVNSMTDMQHLIWSNIIEVRSVRGFLNSR